MCPGLIALLLPALALGQVNVAVDTTADVHPISPLIYGINFADGDQMTLGIPLSRWGGNTTTRYNWQYDVSNTGQDYYYENLPGCWGAGCNPIPTDPQTNSGANGFLALAAQHQVHTLFTVPVMGLVAKAPKYNHPFDCGCPKTLTASQQSFDPYDTNCGNGYAPDGMTRIACDGTSISVAFGATDAQTWGAYLVNRFGASGGQRIYLLDNEPNLWNSTHYDAHPLPTTYDELWSKERDTAVGLLAADPTAEIGAPAEWGWPNYFCSAKDTATGGCSASSPDRAAHGGTELVAWLLQQAKAYQDAHGTRILHWLDLHYYPQGGSGPDNIRSLWDPTYVDPSWIPSTGIDQGKIQLIPRMRAWVAQNYPGTKISLSEYAWSSDMNGALGPVIYAEVLGVFGREQLDGATAWGGPSKTDTAFAAFQLFRNYDGNGARFGDSNVRATAPSGSGVAAFAATGAGRLTVALINETTGSKTVTVQLTGGPFGSTAQWWRTSSNATITRQTDVAVGSGGASVTLPAQSIGMLVVTLAGSGPDGGTPDGGNPPPDGGTGAPDGGSGNPDGGAGPNPANDPLAGISGSCSAGGPRPSVDLPLLLLVASLGLAVRARNRR